MSGLENVHAFELCAHGMSYAENKKKKRKKKREKDDGAGEKLIDKPSFCFARDPISR